MTPSPLRGTPPTMQGETPVLPYAIGEVLRSSGGVIFSPQTGAGWLLSPCDIMSHSLPVTASR